MCKCTTKPKKKLAPDNLVRVQYIGESNEQYVGKGTNAIYGKRSANTTFYVHMSDYRADQENMVLL